MDAGVTDDMPWIRALQERVALTTLSTELGDVKTCLYASQDGSVSVRRMTQVRSWNLTDNRIELLKRPLHGSSGSK